MRLRLSRAAWVDYLPENWGEARLRFVAHVNPSNPDATALGPSAEVSFLPMEAVGEDGSVDLSRKKAFAEVVTGYSSFRDGDILVAKITPCFENGKAARVRGLIGGLGFGSTELHVLRARPPVNVGFLLHLVRSAPFRDRGTASMYGAGGQKRVPSDFFADFVVPLPPASEQEQITAFLDRETAKIDALIAKQNEFLIRLEEHRRALITQAATRGLDPAARLRDTGVETFPKIPQRWQILPIKRVIRPGTSISYGIVQPGDHDPNGIPFVQTADLTRRRLDASLLGRTTPEIARSYPRSQICAGDILLGIRASVGDALVAPPGLDGVNLSRGIARIAPSSAVNPEYLVFVLGTPQTAWFWNLHMQGSTFREISIETVRQLPVPIPPRRDQDAIVNFLNDRLSRLNGVRACSTELADRLRERRAALITLAVTGQIGVTEPALIEAAA